MGRCTQVVWDETAGCSRLCKRRAVLDGLCEQHQLSNVRARIAKRKARKAARRGYL